MNCMKNCCDLGRLFPLSAVARVITLKEAAASDREVSRQQATRHKQEDNVKMDVSMT